MSGRDTLPEGRLEELPDGLADDDDGLATCLLEVLDDLEYEELDERVDDDERDDELEDAPEDDLEADDADREEDDDLELLRDCASRSNWNATNANPISIAANDFADNLIMLELKVNKCGTSAISLGKMTRLSSNIP